MLSEDFSFPDGFHPNSTLQVTVGCLSWAMTLTKAAAQIPKELNTRIFMG